MVGNGEDLPQRQRRHVKFPAAEPHHTRRRHIDGFVTIEAHAASPYSLRLMVPTLFDASAIAWKSNSATVNFWLANGSDSFGETQALSFTTKSLATPK